MSYVHAGHAPEGLIEPTDSWGTLGAHDVAAKGARGAHVGGGVSVRSLPIPQSSRQPSDNSMLLLIEVPRSRPLSLGCSPGCC